MEKNALRRRGLAGILMVAALFWGHLLLAQELADPGASLAQGMEFYKSGKYEEAIAVFSALIRKSVDPQITLKANLYLGYSYFTIAKQSEAKSAVEAAILLKPEIELDPSEFVVDFVKFFQDRKNDMVGVLTIETMPPNARVAIDGVHVGSTPLKRDLLYQKYFLRVVRPGYPALSQNIEISRTQTNNIKVDLTKGQSWKKLIRSSLMMIGVAILVGSI